MPHNIIDSLEEIAIPEKVLLCNPFSCLKFGPSCKKLRSEEYHIIPSTNTAKVYSSVIPFPDIVFLDCDEYEKRSDSD